MGAQNLQIDLFANEVDSDKRIRPNHLLRRSSELIYIRWIRKKVAHTCGYNGNVSLNPEAILKMLFLLFFDNIRSERKRMRPVPGRLHYMWFLAHGLDDQLPDHTVRQKSVRVGDGML